MKFRLFKARILLLIAIGLPLSLLYGQPTHVDIVKMQNDIHIMEGVFDEILMVGQKPFRAFKNKQTHGLFVPGLGIVFRVMPSVFSYNYQFYSGRKKTRKGNSSIVVFQHEGKIGNIDNRDSDANRKRLENVAIEFLRDYSDSIGQLANDDRVIVVYESPIKISAFFYSEAGEQLISDNTGFNFAVSVKKSDIMDYRAEKISKDAFRKRCLIVDRDLRKGNERQIRIFSRALESGLKSYANAEIAMLGEASNLFIDGFGALILFEVKYNKYGDLNILYRLDEMRRQNELYQARVKKINERLQKHGQKITTQQLNDAWASLSLEDTTSSSRLRKAYKQFENKIVAYLLDYGKTIRLLETKDNIAIAVKFRSRYPGLPRRAVYQVKKTTLHDYDINKLKRDEAIKQVSIQTFE